MKTLFIIMTLYLPLVSFSQVPHFHSTTSSTNENAGFFGITNSANDRFALGAATVGTGTAGFFEIYNPSNSSPALHVKTDGMGLIALFENVNSNVTSGIEVRNHGLGSTISSRNLGQGGAGSFTCYSSNNHDVLTARHHGNGNVLSLAAHGTGAVLIANHLGLSGDIAVFRSSSSNQARIDKDGVGYFNGGTQNSGADLAEAFDVWGDRSTYEPGDVLVVSRMQDRSVEKSTTSYSDLIAGVYATKPGVLLTEESIDADLSDKLPMGIVGVIPTKVCDEGGVISRGDILVTASRTGFAMKGDRSRVLIGQVLGKALENFDGQTGKIKVLLGIH